MSNWIAPRYYNSFKWMVAATQNPNHPDYKKFGARGIGCAWNNDQYFEFETWLVGTLGHRPLDHILARKDKLKDFTPRNLCWATYRDSFNQHTRQNIYIKFRGRNQSMSKWASELEIPYHTFRRRIAAGIAVKDIVKEFK